MTYIRKSRNPLLPPKPPKPSRKVGKVTQTVRLFGPEKSKLREQVYLRAKGFCEIRLPGCGGYTPWKSGHLMHVKSVGSGGEDSEANSKWACPSCHGKSHNCSGKPIKISKVSCGASADAGNKEGPGVLSAHSLPGAKPASSVAGEERSGESRPQEKLS